jgi:hypothetical protein
MKIPNAYSYPKIKYPAVVKTKAAATVCVIPLCFGLKNLKMVKYMPTKASQMTSIDVLGIHRPLHSER